MNTVESIHSHHQESQLDKKFRREAEADINARWHRSRCEILKEYLEMIAINKKTSLCMRPCRQADKVVARVNRQFPVS